MGDDCPLFFFVKKECAEARWHFAALLAEPIPTEEKKTADLMSIVVPWVAPILAQPSTFAPSSVRYAVPLTPFAPLGHLMTLHSHAHGSPILLSGCYAPPPPPPNKQPTCCIFCAAVLGPSIALLHVTHNGIATYVDYSGVRRDMPTSAYVFYVLYCVSCQKRTAADPSFTVMSPPNYGKANAWQPCSAPLPLAPPPPPPPLPPIQLVRVFSPPPAQVPASATENKSPPAVCSPPSTLLHPIPTKPAILIGAAHILIGEKDAEKAEQDQEEREEDEPSSHATDNDDDQKELSPLLTKKDEEPVDYGGGLRSDDDGASARLAADCVRMAITD